MRESTNPKDMRYASSLFLSLCAAALVSCKDAKKNSDTASKPTTINQETSLGTAPSPPTPDTTGASSGQTQETFTLDVINGYPEEFHGCACYFARSQAELKQEKYIYFNDYQQKALVSVNGERVQLVGAMKGDSVALNSPYKDSKGRYEVRIRIQKSQQTGDEVASKVGTLLVKDLRTGQTQELPFVGECGC